MTKFNHSSILCFLLLGITLTFSGCLKTRAQLRDESDDRSDSSKSVPAQAVQDVHPQGQYVIDEIKDEMTHLTGRVEDLERSQKDPGSRRSADKEELKKLEERLTEKLTQLEQNQAELQEKLTKLQEAPPVTADPNEVFSLAKSDYNEHDYEKAIEGFGVYLKSPKNIKHLEEATFLRAESYYKLKQFKRAIVEYSKFPEKHARSTRMPEALYKIGLCFEALGMKDDAKGFYQELVEKYPKSLEAKKARKKVK